MTVDVNTNEVPMGLKEIAIDPKSNGKIDIFDLENMMDDKPVEIPEEFKKASKQLQAEAKDKFESNKPPTKQKKVEKEETSDDLGLDEEAEEFLDELDDDSDKKSSKKSALDLLDDETDDEIEESTEELEETVEENKVIDKLDEKVLKQLYKVPLEGGESEEVTLQNLINGYGKNKTGDKKLQEAGEMKKQLNELITKLTDKEERSDILERLIEKSGDGYYDFIESEHARLLKFNMMDDESKEKFIKERNDSKELKLYRQQRELIEKQSKEKEQHDYMNTLYTNIGSAIQEDPLLLKMQQGLTDSNKTYIINKFEAFIKLVEEKKKEDSKFDISYKQISELVKEEIRKDIKNAPKLPDEELEKMSDEQLRALGKSKKQPKQLEKKEIPGVKKSNGISNKQTKKSVKRESTWDFINSFE